MNYPVYKNCWHSNWVGKGIENQTEVKKKKTLNLLKKTPFTLFSSKYLIIPPSRWSN